MKPKDTEKLLELLKKSGSFDAYLESAAPVKRDAAQLLHWNAAEPG